MDVRLLGRIIGRALFTGNIDRDVYKDAVSKCLQHPISQLNVKSALSSYNYF